MSQPCNWQDYTSLIAHTLQSCSVIYINFFTSFEQDSFFNNFYVLTGVQLAAALDPKACHYCTLSRSHPVLLEGLLSLIVSLFFPSPSHPFSFNKIISSTLVLYSVLPDLHSQQITLESTHHTVQSFSTSPKYFLCMRTAALPQKLLPFCSYSVASLGFLCILTASAALQSH